MVIIEVISKFKLIVMANETKDLKIKWSSHTSAIGIPLVFYNCCGLKSLIKIGDPLCEKQPYSSGE